MQTKQPHTKQMDTEQTSLRAELWLREHSPRSHDRQQAALVQFHDLAQNGGHLDALSVHTWSKHIVPSEGTTANCVAPGFVKTDMLADVPEEVQANIRERILLDRFAEVEDIAGIVRFLASKESGYMTGQILSVNSGMEW